MSEKESTGGAFVSVLGIASFLLGWVFLIGGIVAMMSRNEVGGLTWVVVGVAFLLVNWMTTWATGQRREKAPPPPTS